MKKIIATLVFVCVVAVSAFAQTQEGFVNLDAFRRAYIAQYAKFGITERNWKTRMRDNDPTQDAHIVALGGNPNYNDTPLEIALYAHYCPVADPIPAEADKILSKNNQRLVDRQLGTYVYKDLIVYRFLNDTAAVSRHEAMLQFITERGNATRAEIEKFYRDNVRSLIAAVMDEEFNKVSFLLENRNIRKAHNATLMRNQQNGQYTLSYGGVNTNNETRIVTANSLEALATEMSRRQTDFHQTGIDQVRAQAALIPAVKLNAQATDDIKTFLTSFYISPSAGTYNAVKDTYILFDNMAIRDGGQPAFVAISNSYVKALGSLSSPLASKALDDRLGQTVARSLTRDQQQRLVGLR
jgi:hypothetical protein